MGRGLLPEMPSLELFRGIVSDLHGRLPFYSHDWTSGLYFGSETNPPRISHGILAPALYIFAASVLPALAFGQQLASATEGQLTPLQVVFSTAIGGFLQSVVGGQPLLIVGVAEPIVVIYTFLYTFAKSHDLAFLPWSAWICVFTAVFLVILAVTNACNFISHFTRFAGESFGLLIAILFAQVSVLGIIDEFRPIGLGHANHGVGSTIWTPWTLINGLWALFLAFGLTLTSLGSRGARSWRFLRSWLRGLITDYGVPILLVIWTALSFAITYSGDEAQESIPRRVIAPDAWSAGALSSFLTTVPGMSSTPSWAIAAALLPALIIAVLFYFDHSVSSQLAQVSEFNLKKPSSYHYDLLLLAGVTALLGLLGLPPINGVIPQAPMHTRALATATVVVSEEVDESAKDDQNGTATRETKSPTTKQQSALQIPLTVVETRLANLLQSIFCFACVAAMPAVRLIPTSVIWGFFAYLALESLPTSQLFERAAFLLTDPRRRHMVFEKPHAACLQTIRTSTILGFTSIQILLVIGIWALVTFGGLAGIAFPIPIMLLVPVRRYLLPKIFRADELTELDKAEYEEAPGLARDEAISAVDEIMGLAHGSSDIVEGPEERVAEAVELEFHGVEMVHHVDASELRERVHHQAIDVPGGEGASS